MNRIYNFPTQNISLRHAKERRLVEKFRDEMMDKSKAYDMRLKEMTDEEVEREWRMTFPEDPEPSIGYYDVTENSIPENNHKKCSKCGAVLDGDRIYFAQSFNYITVCTARRKINGPF